MSPRIYRLMCSKSDSRRYQCWMLLRANVRSYGIWRRCSAELFATNSASFATELSLFHRLTRSAYLYNGCLPWYNVVLTSRVHSSVKYSQQSTVTDVDGGISVLNHCLSGSKFVNTHLSHSSQWFNIHLGQSNWSLLKLCVLLGYRHIYDVFFIRKHAVVKLHRMLKSYTQSKILAEPVFHGAAPFTNAAMRSRVDWLTEKTFCIYSYIIWKTNRSSFLTPTTVGGGRPPQLKILTQIDPSLQRTPPSIDICSSHQTYNRKSKRTYRRT